MFLKIFFLITVLFFISYIPDSLQTVPLPFTSLKDGDVSIDDVICRGGLILAYKAYDDTPICVSSQSLDILVERNFAKPGLNHMKTVDVLFQNGVIYTIDKNNTKAQAMGITDQFISFIGSDADAESFISNSTKIIDLDGKTIIPGIHDTHLHLLESSSDIGCLIYPQSSVDKIIDMLKDCTGTVNDDWIVGYGHSLDTLLNDDQIPIDILDSIFPDNPAVIMEHTSHSHWVNSLALQRIDINRLATLPGGFIGGTKDNPNGILYENLGDVMMGIALGSNPKTDLANYNGIKFGMMQLAANGITSITEARVFLDRNHHKIWQSASEDELLSTHTVLALYAYPHLDDKQQIKYLESFYNDTLNPKLTQIKVYVDGELGHGTAKLIKPYSNDQSNKGINYFNESRLTQYITQLELVGFDFHIHAIGDDAVSTALNAINNARQVNGDVGARHKITHIELYDPKDLSRFKDLQVVADFQVASLFALPEFEYEYELLLGDKRIDYYNNPFSLYDKGFLVTLSSDWSVSELNPFVGMQHALSKEHKSFPDLESVVRSYTINGAYTMRQDDKTGSLQVSKYADFIILDRDIFKIPIDELSNTIVLSTFFKGKQVYAKYSSTT